MGARRTTDRSRTARPPGRAETATSLSKNPAAGRLASLADSGRTGILHVSGEFGGHIDLTGGAVVGAGCRGTPDLGGRLACAVYPRQAALRSVWGDWLAAEALIDAVAELLSGRPGHARFQPGEPPAASLKVPAATVLAEVGRRQRIMQQMAVLLTPDTTVRRDPHLSSGAVQISAAQWALLMRARDWITPRGLALELSQSVFGTTVEIFRLVSLGLLTVDDGPHPRPHPGNGRGNGGHRLSFLGAVAETGNVTATGREAEAR